MDLAPSFGGMRKSLPCDTETEAPATTAVTYTCVPPGSGERIGVDRDGDGAWDGDEREAQTGPADPDSTP
jgi:hypothetical protein